MTEHGKFLRDDGELGMIGFQRLIVSQMRAYTNRKITEALVNGIITRDVFDVLAVAINTGTNIPSVATPNGQAAFLFLLTSALAPLIRLSYMRMVIMAFPYMIIMTLTGLFAAFYLLEPATAYMYDAGLIYHHSELPGEEAVGHH